MSGFSSRSRLRLCRMASADEPALAETLLRRHRRDVGVEEPGEAPRLRHVAVEAVRLVLREHDDLAQPRVDEVRQGEIDEAVSAAEGNRGFGPVRRQGHEPLALATGEDDSEDLGGRHVPRLGERNVRDQRHVE
jgi:hypothetical protein